MFIINSVINGFVERFIPVWHFTWLGWSLWTICDTNDDGYVLFVSNTSRSFPLSWLITGFVTSVAHDVYHLWSRNCWPFLSTWVHPRFLVGFVLLDLLFSVWCFVHHCLSLCPFSFGRCVVCPSIYGLWLHLWYLQTLLKTIVLNVYIGRFITGLYIFIYNVQD